jgi:hypothetical protein
MNEKTPKTPTLYTKYKCINCTFVTNNKKDYKKHLETLKHINNADLNSNEQKNPELSIYQCKLCYKIYKGRNGLWYHEQKCGILNENIILDSSKNEIKVLTSLVLDLVKNNTELQKQNQEFQKQVLDVCQKIQPATINNTTTTTNNNKTFNLQFFLNEQCKDAMNVSEFVNSFQLNLEDLERVGRHGYVDGISHIILSKLKETDIYKRPFHCSDAKRETLYVKDANGWEREGADNSKMIKAVKDVGQKNFPILNDYRLSHPDCIQADSADNDKYVQMMMAAAGSQKDNVNKVIKKIAKEVVIDK